MAGYTEPSHSYKVKIQSLEDEKREDEGTRKKEKRGEKEEIDRSWRWGFVANEIRALFFCCDFGCQMNRGGHLCVTPGHAIQACRETVRPRGAAFSSSSSLSQREVFFACSTSCGCLLQSRANYRRSMLMGDNVCVSNQHPFRDWPARIPNVGVEVMVSMRKCVLPS